MAPKASHTRGNARLERGSAFLTSLAVVVVMVLLVVGAAARIRTEANTQRARLEGMRADRMADAGLSRVLASLQTHDPNAATTATDEWRELGQDTEEEFAVGTGRFRVQILDAGAFVNLNTASEEQLLQLPLTQEQVESLLDWREAGQFARPLGAKDDYYNALATPYNTALKRLATFSDLLAIKGFDGATLYEAPTGDRVRALTQGAAESQLPLSLLAGVDSACANVGPDGQQRLNVNQVQAQQMTGRGIRQQAAQAIVNRRNTQGTFTSMRDVLGVPGLNSGDFGPILDNLSLNGAATLTGRLNLNSASEEVLRTVPDLPDEAIQSILSRQGTFAGLGELAELPGVTSATLPGLADVFTVNASIFVARIMGIQGNRRSFIEAVVEYSASGPRLLRRETPPFADMDVRWGWSEETSTTTEIVEAE
jgi:DNA uptake protein ComE-like DNA-binding protein